MEQSLLSRLTLPPEVEAIVRDQIASGAYADVSAVVAAALRCLEQINPANGSAPVSGPGFDLSELRSVFAKLEAAKAERDFIIALTASQRRTPHPEAIMQLTVEALGARLDADRAGMYRVAGDMIEFGAGWSRGRIRVLRGRLPLAAIGTGYAEQMRAGNGVVVESHDLDRALNPAEASAGLHAVAQLSAPLLRDMTWVATLFVHHAEPREWSPEEIALVHEVGELTWDAVERADALRQLNADVARGEALLDQAASDLREETAGRVSAEDHVRQMQKMEVVGQLTGGIAHDFNNMLAVVIGGLDLARRRLARGETDIIRQIESALDGASRAAALTHRLLAFSRQQPLAPQVMDPNRLIAGMSDILDRTLGDAIKVELVPGAGVWPIWVDANQLENAILNLAVNARDATPEGGKLTIETANAFANSAYAEENSVAEGQYVVVAVTDNGVGMSPEVAAHAFEPFYTTKPGGKGTGLGLSQVFGFTRQSQGNVKIYSEPGRGTTVKLYLPRFHGEALPTAARRTAPAAQPARGGDLREVILVVEDDERMRNFSVEALRELGYTVIHASSAEDALKLLGADREVSLLFTDIVMSGMSGRQLADQAQALRPGLPVLYTTGFTRNAIVHNGVVDPGAHFLAKPFSVDQLAGAVRRILDRPG